VRPFLEHATVFVAPLRFASGIQNKVLEALAMELPVIASPVAAEGFRTENGDAAPIVVARDEREFATRIVEHLVAADADVAPNPAGRRFVEQHHDWAQCGALLEHVLLDVSSRAAK
jgi:glycosyltransferase involved in cell wall biosynthesis